MPHISDQQRRFVEAYVQCGDAEQAVLTAGYQARNTAHRADVLMSNPYIQREIKRYRRMLELEPQIKALRDWMKGGDNRDKR